MAPLPETEILTIKRLEVALRRLDFKQLKDGAYKLHEKYHSGFKFEYIDLLKEILSTVENTPNVPQDIKDILIPTIEDILSGHNNNEDNIEAYNQENRVSSLTSLSYSTKKEEPKLELQMKTVVQSPFSAQPFSEFSTPKYVVNSNSDEKQVEPQNNIETTEQLSLVENIEEKEEPVYENNVKTKKITLFYGENSLNNEIVKFEEAILKFKNNSLNLKDLIDIINQIKYKLDNNTLEFKRVLDAVSKKESKTNIVTNSINPKIINHIEGLEIPYGLFDLKSDNKINFLPLFGVLNSFKCSNCDGKYLNTTNISPFIIECPKCKKPMFYDISSLKEINFEYYNSMISSFMGSDVWILINPMKQKEVFDAVKTILNGLNNKEIEIFIIDYDINLKESIRNTLSSISSKAKIKTDFSLLEEFLNTID